MVRTVDRLTGAACLDRAVYAELRWDTSARSQALWLVTLLGIAHGVGGVMRGIAFGWSPWEGALFGLVGELLFFLVTSLVIFVLGRFAFGVPATYGQVLRPFAFSSVPGFLILVAAALSLVSQPMSIAILLAIITWRVAAGIVAVREALGLNAVRSLPLVIIGVVVGMGAVGMGSRVLVLLIRAVSGES